MAAKKTAKERLGPHQDIDAPGLIWRAKASGYTPYWRAPKWYVDKNGKWMGHTNLSLIEDDPSALLARCVSLQSDANAWKAGVRGYIGEFDFTFGQIINKYLTDKDSTFFSLRHGSRHPYEFYAKKLEYELGELRVDEVTGIDLRKWHDEWSDGGEKLAAAKMMRAVLDAAIAFTIMSAKPGTPELRAASELRTILKTASRKLPGPKRRESVVTADQVVALRAAAHEDNRRSCALAYALVFETTLRLWDVIGQWVPMESPGISEVVKKKTGSMRYPQKWFGLRWEDINENLVLHYVPSKTSMKTGLAVTYPLTMAPMVVEELAHWPIETRSGPVIVNEGNGLPYGSNYFGEKWAKDRLKVGLPPNIWARDMRASGVTEGRDASVAIEDVAKVAGHSSTKTTSRVYDRAALAAAERFAEARTKKRGKKAG